MASGFESRKRGLSEKEEQYEMANDMANLNRMAPAVQSQHQAGSWQSEQIHLRD